RSPARPTWCGRTATSRRAGAALPRKASPQRWRGEWAMAEGQGTGALRRSLNLAAPDDVYNAIVDAHKGLSDEQCRAFDARLILLLVNHIGDEAVIREALTEALP